MKVAGSSFDTTAHYSPKKPERRLSSCQSPNANVPLRRRRPQRGVSLTLVLEAEQESKGQLTRDALSAFSPVSAAGCRIYYWPIDQRTRNAAGKPGKLHAKCAVIDSSAIIGSANLTDDAFNRNLELGILIRGGPTPEQTFSHFKALIDRGVLREISPPS
jgi:cardiolipin synthase A/B